MRAVIAEPAYWAFCWGSGLALARYLLDEPHWVSGKHVLDLGSGSGIAGIAAARAGAAHVTACDIDPDARLATQANAALNSVPLHVTDSLPDRSDITLLADVLYDKSNLPLLETAAGISDVVLVADSRISNLDRSDYSRFLDMNALTHPNLGEFDEFRTVHFFVNGRKPQAPCCEHGCG